MSYQKYLQEARKKSIEIPGWVEDYRQFESLVDAMISSGYKSSEIVDAIAFKWDGDDRGGYWTRGDETEPNVDPYYDILNDFMKKYKRSHR